jgi:putative transposase
VNYRRYRVEGATYFFTVVTDGRAPIFVTDDGRAILRAALRGCMARWPFALDAIVLLPDHLHALWTLPPDDANYSRRWGWVKKEFTKAWLAGGNPERAVSAGRAAKRQRGVLQPRFWEHLIRDEADFERHADYIHYNPVKHGYAEAPRDWRWSSFRRFVAGGAYPDDWGTGAELTFPEIDARTGE